MRELTKSVLRFSWAMPFFGAQQVINLALPSGANQESVTRACDAVNTAAQREMGGAFRGLYEAGDQVQSGLIDTAFRFLPLDLFDPARWLAGAPPPSTTGSPSRHGQWGPKAQ